MIKQELMDRAIDESYDALALIEVAVVALGALELDMSAPHNGTVSSIQKALRISYRKLEVSHDALEHVVSEGFMSQGVASHG
nr:hypothetical protein [Brucella anthropi]